MSKYCINYKVFHSILAFRRKRPEARNCNLILNLLCLNEVRPKPECGDLMKLELAFTNNYISHKSEMIVYMTIVKASPNFFHWEENSVHQASHVITDFKEKRIHIVGRDIFTQIQDKIDLEIVFVSDLGQGTFLMHYFMLEVRLHYLLSSFISMLSSRVYVNLPRQSDLSSSF